MATHARATAPVLTISAAAELAGIHAQTLRQYDRLGLVRPHRTRGGGRRYSLRDVALLREVQHLSQDEGVNLAGIQRIFELQREVEALSEENQRLRAVVDPGSRIFAAGPGGEVVAVPRGRRARREALRGNDAGGRRGSRIDVSEGAALVLWRPSRITGY